MIEKEPKEEIGVKKTKIQDQMFEDMEKDALSDLYKNIGSMVMKGSVSQDLQRGNK